MRHCLVLVSNVKVDGCGFLEAWAFLIAVSKAPRHAAIVEASATVVGCGVGPAATALHPVPARPSTMYCEGGSVGGGVWVALW